MVDLLSALPDVQTTIISQFAPDSESFQVFSSALTRHGLGRDSKGRTRLQFLQDARSYGPWPRDQAVIDIGGRMWVSDSDQHQLQSIFSSLDLQSGFERHDAPISFAGANLLVCGQKILCPDRLDSSVISSFIEGPIVSLPSPPAHEPFHLDLLVMPLSENLVAVGDDGLARTMLMSLSPEEMAASVARWAAEYAGSANNIELSSRANGLMFRRTHRPSLILWPFLKEKLQNLVQLLRPGVFKEIVENQAPYPWDDRIASALEAQNFEVVRIPFWPGETATQRARNQPALPMLCYPNCLVWEDGILMPTYGIEHLDDLARSTLEKATDKTVYPVRGGAILGFGSSGPHCLTLEVRKPGTRD